MRDIYQEAQLSPGAVYHYFESKDAIIQASIEFDRQRSQHLFDDAVASDDPMQALCGLTEFFFQGLESAAALGAGRVNVQGWGEALVNPAVSATLNEAMSSYRTALSQVVRNAQNAGQVDPTLDPESVSRLVLSSYYGLELQKALDPEIEVTPYRTAVEQLMFKSNS